MYHRKTKAIIRHEFPILGKHIVLTTICGSVVYKCCSLTPSLPKTIWNHINKLYCAKLSVM